MHKTFGGPVPGHDQNRSGRPRLSAMAVILITLILLASCHKITGDGPVMNETRQASGYTGIAMNVPGTLRFVPDSIYTIDIKAQSNIQRFIETTVEEGELRIAFKRNARLGKHKPIEVTIHAPGISGFSIGGSADIFIVKPLVADRLALSIAGSGNIHTDRITVQQSYAIVISGSGSVYTSVLESPFLKVNISGSGSLLADAGKINDGEISTSGSGKTDISSVEAKNITIRSSGSGDARLHVTGNLDIHISGSGSIYYKGNPRITSHISGSGKIVPF